MTNDHWRRQPLTGNHWTRRLLAVAVIALAPSLATSQQASYYVLDGFGGVHAGGDAPAITPATPFFGFDIARDLAFVPVGLDHGGVVVAGDGMLVLDGFGGIHTGGALVRSMVTPGTPYFGFDVARAIAYRNVPPRVAGREEAGTVELVPGAGPVAVATTTIWAPDDGFLMVTAAVMAHCRGSSSGSRARVDVYLGLDSVSPSSARQSATLADCSAAPYDSVPAVKTLPVSAGAHVVHLLGAAVSPAGGTRVFVLSRSLQVLFVDQDGAGGS